MTPRESSLVLFAVVSCALVAAGCRMDADPIEVANYRCRDHGGVQSTSSSKTQVNSAVCEDGTAVSTYMRTEGGKIPND